MCKRLRVTNGNIVSRCVSTLSHFGRATLRNVARTTCADNRKGAGAAKESSCDAIRSRGRAKERRSAIKHQIDVDGESVLNSIPPRTKTKYEDGAMSEMAFCPERQFWAHFPTKCT